jgi:hypothetical protein
MAVSRVANSDTFKVSTPSDTDIRITRLFDAPRQLWRVDRVLVPAGAHLDRHRNLDRSRHRANDSRRVLRLAHEAAPGVVLRNLRHRAAHVHVDDVGSHPFDDLRGRSHLLRVAAEDLN